MRWLFSLCFSLCAVTASAQTIPLGWVAMDHLSVTQQQVFANPTTVEFTSPDHDTVDALGTPLISSYALLVLNAPGFPTAIGGAALGRPNPVNGVITVTSMALAYAGLPVCPIVATVAQACYQLAVEAIGPQGRFISTSPVLFTVTIPVVPPPPVPVPPPPTVRVIVMNKRVDGTARSSTVLVPPGATGITVEITSTRSVSWRVLSSTNNQAFVALTPLTTVKTLRVPLTATNTNMRLLVEVTTKRRTNVKVTVRW